MDNTGGSPIKAFLKRHSPIKTRSKAVVSTAKDNGSPKKARAPMRELPANVSPTKEGKENKEAKGAKRKFSGFIRGKPATTDEPPLPSKHRRISSVPGKVDRTEDQVTNAKVEDDSRLADRVQHLEAELEAARAELAQSNTNTSPRRKAMSPRRLRPQAAKRSHSYDVHTDFDQDTSARQERLLRGNKYDGLVESLLERDFESANARAASYSTRSVSAVNGNAGPESGRKSALASYGELERSHMDDDEARNAELLKRKRSELRAAEWKRIQEAYDRSPQRTVMTSSKRGHDASAASTAERPSRRQKQAHEPGRDKSMQLSAQHSRRSASESHAPSAMELKRDSIKPIQSQPYKIEFVKARPRTPESAQGHQMSRSPPKNRTTYDLMKAFGSNTPNERAKANENIETFGPDDEQSEKTTEDQKAGGAIRRAPPSPSRLHTVREEFEWDDEVF